MLSYGASQITTCKVFQQLNFNDKVLQSHILSQPPSWLGNHSLSPSPSSSSFSYLVFCLSFSLERCSRLDLHLYLSIIFQSRGIWPGNQSVIYGTGPCQIDLKYNYFLCMTSLAIFCKKNVSDFTFVEMFNLVARLLKEGYCCKKKNQFRAWLAEYYLFLIIYYLLNPSHSTVIVLIL